MPTPTQAEKQRSEELRAADILLEKILGKMHTFELKFGHLVPAQNIKSAKDELLDLKRTVWWKR